MEKFPNTISMIDCFDYSKEQPMHAKLMQTYLISKCAGCSQIPCFNYHTGQAKRRLPVLYSSGIWSYRPVLCQKQLCPYKDFCLFAHNIEEINFHPLTYKTRECYDYAQQVCQREQFFCFFAHGDLRPRSDFESALKLFNPKSFKLNPCQITVSHSYKICENYHQINDQRRDPELFQYSTKLCENPDCRNENCQFAHNEIEVFYHPDYYKTLSCTFDPCMLYNACPFLHAIELKKIEDTLIQKESNDLVVKIEMLEGILKCEVKKEEEMKDFFCSQCKSPCVGILQCGHLVCETCKDYCKICEISSPMVVIKDLPE